MANPPQTHDEYLAALPADQRKVLQKLRQTIRSVAPQAEECISYQIAAYRQGPMLVGYGATPKHCALFLMSNSTIAAHAGELAGYDTSTGTIRFQPDKPLPVALVKKLVQARLDENAARAASKQKSPYGGRKASGKPTEQAGAATSSAAKKRTKAPAKKTTSAAGAPKAPRTPRRKTTKRGPAPATDGPGPAPAVESFLSQHPLQAELRLLREIILGASPGIQEEIKWNSPSFFTREHFATLNNPRTTNHVRLVLHLGAKPRDVQPLQIPDPEGLIQWLAKDRGLVTLANLAEIRARRPALEAIIRSWLRYV